MGHTTHHAIVVTSWRSNDIEAAVHQAKSIGLIVLGPSEIAINGYQTMVVCPDGSKDHWPDSDHYDRLRSAFLGWMRTRRYNDGRSTLEWAEIEYGNDAKEAVILSHAWMGDDCGVLW